jgi:hypothetical protein
MALTASPEYRQQLIESLLSAAEGFCAACRSVGDPFEPLEEGGWNTHQIAVHTRDTDEKVYGPRIRRSTVEDNPLFPNFDGDAWMAEHYRADEPLEAVLDGFSGSITDLAALLRSLPEDGWNRPSRHETLGDFVLQSWVEKSLAHIEEHRQTVQKPAA